MNRKKSIFQLLTEKPWETDQIEADNDHEGRTVNISKQKLGLRTIMAASTVLFSLFVIDELQHNTQLHLKPNCESKFCCLFEVQSAISTYGTVISVSLSIEDIAISNSFCSLFRFSINLSMLFILEKFHLYTSYKNKKND